MVERLFLAVPQGCLRFVIVVFPDHTHLLFLCWSFYCNIRLGVLSSLEAIVVDNIADCFTFIMLLMFCGCLCSVFLPPG